MAVTTLGEGEGEGGFSPSPARQGQGCGGLVSLPPSSIGWTMLCESSIVYVYAKNVVFIPHERVSVERHADTHTSHAPSPKVSAETDPRECVCVHTSLDSARTQFCQCHQFYCTVAREERETRVCTVVSSTVSRERHWRHTTHVSCAARVRSVIIISLVKSEI